MSSPIMEVRGLKELQQRMAAYPQKMRAAIKTTMEAALLVLWENVPPYPPPPDGSTYNRTGTLGRTLGSGAGGGKSGSQPDVYTVRPFGSGYEARFGTNLDYAPPVIGEDTQSRHMGHWWKISAVAEKARDKIEGLFETMAEKMAAFLEGKGG